ncbi:TRAFAC clade GTPase domain-containing protein [Stieleria varia]|uniref:Double-GTPase 2 domain-containing protein n=1 Tax=Stieleria varia TaxID=2528005 RepID=A0A5C6AZ00_9BACT|nr:hypothetical protein [Stieleria varia]TWU04379.1 hypothetical protein Pla52n_24190 [Stieleria varia]
MTKELRCPYCTNPVLQCVQAGKCPLPIDYEKKCAAAPATWITSVGFSGHGKTVYLSALSLMLDQLADAIPNFTCDYLDQYTLDTVREMRWQAKNGSLSESTQPRNPQPLMMQIDGRLEPSSPSTKRTLVIYDAAGEFFTSLETLNENLPAIEHVQTIWFLVSVSDFRQSEEQTSLTDLFRSYQAAMESSRVDLRGRQIIVVFTKSELIRRDLPADVIEYLSNDPFADLNEGTSKLDPSFSVSHYLEKAAEISDLLESFAETLSGGRQFINMVRKHQMRLRFVATSALGHHPDDSSNRLIERAKRYRVLDPLFWTIAAPTEQSVLKKDPLLLIVDCSSECDPFYANDTLQQYWRAMSSHGDTWTHYLGGLRPASHVGQQPPESPSKQRRSRIIGSILDRAPAGCRALVLTAGPIIDIADFVTSPLRDRILIGVADEQFEDIWPHTFVIRPNDDPNAVVHRLIHLDREASFVN